MTQLNDNILYKGKIHISRIIIGKYTNPISSMTSNITLMSPPWASIVLLSWFLVGVSGEKAIAQPSVYKQPSDASVSMGANVVFTVTAQGTAPVSYNWNYNDNKIPGATNVTLSLTNVSVSQEGSYSVSVSDAGGTVVSRAAELKVDPTFTKITTGSVATDLDWGWGCSWGDYDNDGFIDLVVDAGVPDRPRPLLLYHNNGDGTFTKVTNTLINAFPTVSNALLWGDYDNDGHLDLFCTGEGSSPNRLFRNTGNGKFSEVTSLPGRDGDGIAAAWVDYDQDGFLDLTVGATYGQGIKLYRNTRDGAFVKQVLVGAGAVALIWNLYDNQGAPELLSIDNIEPNTLWRKKDNGTFVSLPSTQSPFTKLPSGDYASAVAADFRNSGNLDVFIASGLSSAVNDLYFHNNGDGTFTQLTTTNQVGDVVIDRSFGACSAAADYDNDGYLDIFVTAPNGRNNRVYHNRGDGTFERVTLGSLGSDSAESWGCAWGDYNNDGFMDLYVANGGWHDQGLQNGFLYCNNGNGNHWLKLNLVGTVANRSAIGTTVRLEATIGGKTFWQRRDVSGGGNWWSQDDQRPNFGLGDATNAQTIRIEWLSGTVQELRNVAVNQILTVKEPPKMEIARAGEVQVRCWQGMKPEIEVSTNLVDWVPLVTLSVTNTTGRTAVQDTGASVLSARYYRTVLR